MVPGGASDVVGGVGRGRRGRDDRMGRRTAVGPASRRRRSCPPSDLRAARGHALVGPTMTVRVNGVAASDCVPTTERQAGRRRTGTSGRPSAGRAGASCSPAGSSVGRRQGQLEVRRDSRGPARRTSRPRRPLQVWIVCVWQFDGQCWRTSDHDSALAGRAAPWPSVAWPVKRDRCRRPSTSALAAGVSMTGVGQGVVDQDRAAGGRRSRARRRSPAGGPCACPRS